MDDTRLIEAELVVDDENLLIETKIPDVDDIDVDKDAEKICSYSNNKVLCSLENKSVECTCRHFLRYEFLCRRELCVLKNRDIEGDVEVQVPKPPSWTPENVIEDIDVVEQATNASGISYFSRMSNTSDKGTTFGDGAARVGMQL
ncbi:hypothetical protein Tco_0658415 [Tanacetum coccineum]